LEQNLRIHITAVGFDPPQRVTKPLIDLRADKAHLITHEDDSTKATKVLNDVRSIMSKKMPSCQLEVVKANIWNLESCFKEYRRIFSEEHGNHLYVNVSTGSRFVSIAGMLACMLWDGTPYYAKLDYVNNPDRVTETVFLPAYRIRQPDNELMAVLEVLFNNGGKMSKKMLISALQSPDKRLIPIYPEDSSKTAPHSKLRAYLEPLEREWGFVLTKSKGRRSEVAITERGKEALQIFGLTSASLPMK
jgi:hypothetical protein